MADKKIDLSSRRYTRYVILSASRESKIYCAYVNTRSSVTCTHFDEQKKIDRQHCTWLSGWKLFYIEQRQAFDTRDRIYYCLRRHAVKIALCIFLVDPFRKFPPRCLVAARRSRTFAGRRKDIYICIIKLKNLSICAGTSLTLATNGS